MSEVYFRSILSCGVYRSCFATTSEGETLVFVVSSGPNWTLSSMFFVILACLSFLTAFVVAQTNTPYCDSASGICLTGYTDPDLDITVGFILPEDDTSTEYIVQMVAPVTYGYTGVSMGGTMANSLLFVMWPYDNEIVFSTRWSSGYVQPTVYSGPTITMLKGSIVNSTHIAATFRCQNCTVWEGGSLGSGNTTAFELIAYVAQTTTEVDTPSDPASTFIEHDQFDFFGADLSTAHSSSYNSYISNGASSSSSSASHTSTPTTTPPKSTSSTSTASASGATQTKYGQCGGTGYTGPTVCASGSTCTAVSPPYYSQCV